MLPIIFQGSIIYGMRYNKNVMMKSGSESKLGAIVNISRILLCLLSLRTLKEESLNAIWKKMDVL